MRKKKHPHQHTKLYMFLVGIFFGLAVLLWLPQFIRTINAFGTGVIQTTGGTQNVFSSLREQWKQAKDRYEKALPSTELSSAGLSKELAAGVKNELARGFPVSDSRVPQQSQEKNLPKATCTRNAGYYQERSGPGGLSYAVCIFNDGSECETELFYRSKCHKGQYSNAEDGIPKKPDLFLMLERAAPCQDQETRLCLSGLRVSNQGWKTAPQTIVRIGTDEYPVPSLVRGQEHVFSEAVKVARTTPETQPLILEIDPQSAIDEILEDNNIIELSRGTLGL